MMTPKEFADKYLSMDIFFYPLEADASDGSAPGNIYDGWQTLRCANYRLGSSTWPDTFWQDIEPHLSSPITITVKPIDGDAQELTLDRNQLLRHFHPPFVGKGSPEQCQIATQLIYRYHKAKSTPDEFMKQDFIGLDCNGFVGNYIQRVVQGQDWTSQDNDKDPGPTTLISDLLRVQGGSNQIADIDSLQADETYLLGFCSADGLVFDPSRSDPNSFGHVMITEPGTLTQVDGGWQICVVEATAAANRELRYLNYTITGTTQGSQGTVFQVLRGSPNDKMNVRIARLAVSAGADAAAGGN